MTKTTKRPKHNIVFIARIPFRLKRDGSIDWKFDAEKYLGWKS